jgi:recombination protein RecA
MLDDPNRMAAIRWMIPMGLNLVTRRIIEFGTPADSFGLPSGRIVEVFGKPESGKTTLATHFMASAQRTMNAMCVLIDTENAYDPKYAQAQGVDISRVIGLKALSIEEVYTMAMDSIRALRLGEITKGNKTIKTQTFDGPILIVVDSIGQTATLGEISKFDESAKKGEAFNLPMAAARVINSQMRVYTPFASEHNICTVFLNHTYTGQPPYPGAQAPEISYGGEGIKFAASLRIKTTQFGKIMEDDREIGSRISIHFLKNKIHTWSGKIELDVVRGRGLRETGTLVDELIESGVLKPVSGRFRFIYQGVEQNIHGKEKFINWIESNPGAIETIMQENQP